MELHLKKRIVGAWLTVTAVLVVAPIVLDGSRTQVLLESAAPAKPETEAWATQEYERQVRRDVEELASGAAAEEIAMPPVKVVDRDDAAPQGVPADRTSLDADKVPYAWTLQVGAFSKRDNAHRFRDLLRHDGFKAYVQEFPDEGITRVYVGPELRRADAEKAQQALMQRDDIQAAYLRRYLAES
ncbi:MAG: SPOR domain-containing protein [Pseudomonadota bacterium]|nr:SPOR domain-containing protein [Pseudomonadota bacterium]